MLISICSINIAKSVVVKVHTTDVEDWIHKRWKMREWCLEHWAWHTSWTIQNRLNVSIVAYERIANDDTTLTSYNTHICYVFYLYFIAAKRNVSMVVILFFFPKPLTIQKRHFQITILWNRSQLLHLFYIVIFHFKWCVHLCAASMCLMSGWKLILIPNEKWFLLSTLYDIIIL